ncbi:MAG: hypothetical protein QOH76_2060 [Thermoleophilaceae bacterium]|jgi:hypothetical protein|nr:hypothetical protein [Thermoleophilaceae bacterium]
MLAAALDTSSTAYQVGTVAGMAAVAVVAIVLARLALNRRGLGDGVIAVAAVLVAGFLLVRGGTSLAGDHASGPWSTNTGRSMKAGFIDGCSNGTPRPRCECMFARISSTSPYDTPNGFWTLQHQVQRFAQTRDPSMLPRVMVDAVRACQT